MTSTKNATDAELHFTIGSVGSNPHLGDFILVQWATDPALFAQPGARDITNSWPYDDGSAQQAIIFVADSPSVIEVPTFSWQFMSSARVLYYIMSWGQSYDLSDPGWQSYPMGSLVINHPPTANAGPPQVVDLDNQGNSVTTLTLDASYSDDVDLYDPVAPDPGPLTYRWEVDGSPGSQPAWLTLPSALAQATFISSGTPVRDDQLGTYKLKLIVQDTDVPLASSHPGVGTATVDVTVQRYGGGVGIASPTNAAPATFAFGNSLDVPIVYRIDPGLLTDPAFAGGYFARLRIVLKGQTVVEKNTTAPSTDLEGTFHWDGVFDNLNLPEDGDTFDIEVSVCDAAGIPPLLTGRRDKDYQDAAVVINAPTITLSRASAVPITLSKLLDNSETVSVNWSVTLPDGSPVGNTPIFDEYRLAIFDATDTYIGEYAVPLVQTGPPVSWNGDTGGQRISAPGKYSIKVRGYQNSNLVAHSKPLVVYALKFEIDVQSPNSVMDGTTRLHRITAAPAMPTLTVTPTITGFDPGQDATLVHEYRLETLYTGGDRNDHLFTPGPDDQGWRQVPAGTANWIPAGLQFQGGDLTVHCRVVIDGLSAGDKTLPLAHRIWGTNPASADVRAAYGDNAFNVAIVQESVFKQFDRQLGPGAGPHPPLLGADPGGTFGYGIGQLTIPAPTVEQIWNWRANVVVSAALFQTKRGYAFGYQAQVQQGLPWANPQTGYSGSGPPNEGTAFPLAPAFSADQLNLEMWCRYNSGLRYHNYQDIPNHAWIRRPYNGAAHTGPDYADEAAQRLVNVNNGIFPLGW